MWEKLGNIYSRNHSQVPVVECRGSSWRVFYSDRIDGKSIPKYFDIAKKNFIILEDSQETISSLGKRGMFDWAGVMPTYHTKIDENTSYLYYIGWSNRIDVPYHNNLGLILTEDGGLSYKKFSRGPIFSTSHKEPGYIGTISVMQEEELFRGWYLSCREWIEHEGRVEPTYDIKYAYSKNGIDWIPTNDTCISLNNDEGGISQSAVIKQDDTYHMWFSSRNRTNFREKENSYRIRHAISKDGITWLRSPGTDFGLEISQDGWDSEMVAYPYVIKEGNDLYMFYNGNGFGKTGIGLARWKKFNKSKF